MFRLISSAIVGVALGLACAFLAIITTIAGSAILGVPVAIPFYFSALVGEENGLPSVEFVPNAIGILVSVLGIAVGYALIRGARRARS